MFLIHVFLYAGVYCIYRPCNQNSVGGGGGGRDRRIWPTDFCDTRKLKVADFLTFENMKIGSRVQLGILARTSILPVLRDTKSLRDYIADFS